MFGRDLQCLAAVDNSPDLRRLRPANLSKIGAETSSLHVIQSFKAHSGAGPLLGIAFANFSSFSSESVSVLFFDDANLSLSVAGKSYHLFDSVDDSADDRVTLPSRSSSTSLSPPNCGMVARMTQEPKQFLAVFQDVSAQSFAQSWVIPRPR